MRTYNVAVVGATGAVGKTMLEILESRKFPINEIFPLASERSAGDFIDFNKKQVQVADLAHFDFSKADIALFSAGAAVSAEYVAKCVDSGCVMIDNTSYFRNEEDVPLVVPEVNPEAIAEFKQTGIIANPNCSTIQMLVALAPIHKKVGIERINVATYQSVSGAGNKGIDELSEQTRSLLNFRPLQNNAFSQQIAFNVIPQIDEFQDNGYTREEMKMVWETQKILGDRSVRVNPTCVRVPVFYGHAEAVHIETTAKITADEVKSLMQNTAGVELMDDPASMSFASPSVHSAGNDPVYVSRIREDISIDHGINMWIVSDNIRKGAALNSVQIAEELIKLLDKE
ncbi:aspartate-semialdehyde dehydrogenase [Marinicella rhabdoformis]|uniref:aspartate-semialdehyde dehydrogenase n=1 Tax=Marinicella rhabdoformis TaxID=2580566 RepID=UPI0012AECB55|nr:aspartate-semialdehyde dehydrogenase [Marinicella rhabdoformis]